MANTEVRKYFVKGSWIFNLEAMHDKVWCLIYDIQEGKLACPFKVAGKTIHDTGDLHDLLEEAEELEWRAKRGKVTSKEYGRIKALVSWRVEQRYYACINSGMAERDAGLCFTDM